MSQNIDISTLADYSPRTWVQGEDADASKFQTDFDAIETAISNLNKAAQDVNSSHSGATAPTPNTIAGQIFFDTDVDIWYGDPDASGADDEFLTRIKAYSIDLATAGTDTFKLSGVTQRNTTENGRTTTGVLRAFTIAAGVVGTNNQALRLTAYLDKSGASGTCTIQVRFGTTPTSRISFAFTADTTGAYYIEAILSRISATAVDVAGVALSEAEGDSVAAFNAGSADIDLTVAQTLDLNLSAISAGTVTFQGAFVEILL